MFKWLLPLLLFPIVSVAQQRIPIQEGVEVTAKIAPDALNRIAVQGDRIVQIKGITGQFEYDKDETLGQIFIKPTIAELDKPIQLFMMTEKGYTYSLKLTNQATGAESIVLVPFEENVAWEKASSYEAALKEIIKAMHTQSVLEGFSIQNAKLNLPKIQGAKVTHLQSYAGKQLLGQILEVTNTSQTEVLLTEQAFYFEGVRAISIVEPIVPVGHKTRVYWVR